MLLEGTRLFQVKLEKSLLSASFLTSLTSKIY